MIEMTQQPTLIKRNQATGPMHNPTVEVYLTNNALTHTSDRTITMVAVAPQLQ